MRKWFQPINQTRSLCFYLKFILFLLKWNRWFHFKRNEEDVLCEVALVTFQFVCLHKSEVGHSAVGMEAFRTAFQTFLLGCRVWVGWQSGLFISSQTRINDFLSLTVRWNRCCTNERPKIIQKNKWLQLQLISQLPSFGGYWNVVLLTDQRQVITYVHNNKKTSIKGSRTLICCAECRIFASFPKVLAGSGMNYWSLSLLTALDRYIITSI